MAAPVTEAQPPLITTAQAAAVLGVRTGTVTRWRRQGLIQAALRLPGATGAYLFDPSEVERLRVDRAARGAAAWSTDAQETREVVWVCPRCRAEIPGEYSDLSRHQRQAHSG